MWLNYLKIYICVPPLNYVSTQIRAESFFPTPNKGGVIIPTVWALNIDYT